MMLLIIVIFTFLMFAFVLLLVVHLTNDAIAFDVVPTSTDIDIKTTGVKAGKEPYSCLCRIHRLHKGFFTEHSDLFTDMVNHYPTGRLVSAKLKD